MLDVRTARLWWHHICKNPLKCYLSPFLSLYVHKFIWQKLQEKNLDTWKNIRGPRPWEDSKEYQEQQRASLNKGAWSHTCTHSCLFQPWDVETGSPTCVSSFERPSITHIWACKVVCMWTFLWTYLQTLKDLGVVCSLCFRSKHELWLLHAFSLAVLKHTPCSHWLSLDHLNEYIGRWFKTYLNNWWCLG